MNIKYDNSMFTTVPPTTLTSEYTEVDELEEAIDEYNYERNSLLFFDYLEQAEISELIKNEQS